MVKFNFDSPKPKVEAPKAPVVSDEKASDTSVSGLAEKIKSNFPTPEDKALVSKEIVSSIKDKFSQFTPEFQAKYSDGKGNPDYAKITALFGLDESISSNVKKIADKGIEPTVIGGKIPENPGSMSGDKFISEMKGLGNMNSKEVQAQMEKRVMEEIAKGNIPSWCRPENMKTIGMKGADGTVVKFKAGLDYLAIGSDSNFIRVPITPVLAQQLSAQYGWGMPTRDMAHAIHDTADIKLKGGTLALVHNEDDQLHMQGADFINTHNTNINTLLGPDGLARLQSGQSLVAGHKKDVIISRYVLDHPNGALDYSGLYLDGKNPIQDNPAHEWSYRDYSHGFRPIGGNVVIAYPDGHTESKPYYEALQDPRVAQVLNGAEGAIDAARAYRQPGQIGA